MLAYDRFPYYAPAATDADFAKARGLLDGFAVVALSEAYDDSVRLLLAVAGVGPVAETYAGVALKSVEALGTAKVATETVRNFSASYAPFKAALARNATRRRAIAAANPYDMRLYEHGRAIFCRQLGEHGLGAGRAAAGHPCADAAPGPAPGPAPSRGRRRR